MAKLKPDYIKWVLSLNADQARDEYHKLEKDNRELAKQTKACRDEMARLEAQGQKGSDQWNALSKSIKDNDKAMRDNKARMDALFKQMDISGMTVKELKKHLKDLQKQFENTSKSLNPEQFRSLQEQIRETKRAIAEAKGETENLHKSFLSLDGIKALIVGVFMGVGQAALNYVVGAFKQIKQIVMGFSAENARLAAILGTTKDGIVSLTEQAKELGRTTSYTASEVTRLQIELAKLGFTQQQIEAMTPSVLKFAKSVGTDLPSASAFAGAALRIFNKDASEAENVLASFAISTTKTALDFSKLESALSTVGPVANAFGFSLEDTTALLGILANQGFDASTAATSLRNIMLKLCDTDSELAKALGEPVKSAADLSKGLQKLKADGVDLQKALDMTDKRSVAAFTSIMNSADQIDELSASITDVNDEFAQMSATMGDTAAAAEKGFYSAVEGLLLQFGGLENILKAVYKAFTAFVQVISWSLTLFSPLVSMFNGLLKVLRSIGSVVATIVSPFKQWAENSGLLNKVLKGLQGLLSGLVSSLTVYIALTKVSITGIKNKITSLWAEVKATMGAKTAQDALNDSMRKNPILLVVSLIAGLVAAVISYTQAAREAAKAEDDLTNIRNEAKKQIVDEKIKIESLLAVARDETASLESRKKAVDALNKIIPDYNGQLDETTGKYKENKKALDKYLESLTRMYEIEGAKSMLQEIGKRKAEITQEISEKQAEIKKTEQRIKDDPPTTPTDAEYRVLKIEKLEGDIERLNQELNKIEQREKNILTSYGKDIANSFADAENNADKVNDALDEEAKRVKRLAEIEKELKELRKKKKNPANDAELDEINKRIKALQAEKKLLEGKAKAKREVGTYGQDSVTEVKSPIDAKHQERTRDIDSLKGEISDTELAIKKNRELIRYCEELDQALEALAQKTDKTHTQTLDKIATEQNKVRAQMQEAQQQLDQLDFQRMTEVHTKRMAADQTFYDTQAKELKKAVAEQRITQEAADIYSLSQQRSLHAAQLKELLTYYRNVESSDYLGANEKAQLLTKLQGDIRKAQSQVLTDTANWTAKMREATANPTSIEGIKASFDVELKSAEQYYDALIAVAAQSGEDVAELEAAKQRKIDDINYRYLEEQYKLQELTGLSWEDEYARELAKLENYHSQGLMSEEKYQKARLDCGVKNAKKYFDYYSQLSGSMFSAIQDAEIAQSEAKYDVLIQQAKNNGEDTAKLEEEKENEKLKIQKKYADVDFAIKVAEIIANTAVAIMTAYKQLGPVAGSVAAAMLTVTGLAQVATAEAQREKIKNMQPGSTSSGSSTTAERVLTGFSDGGYTGDGGRFEVAGVVHRGEYVVPKPIMSNPKVVDAVGVIEAIRRGRGAESRSYYVGGHTGYAEGGYVGGGDMADVVAELRSAIDGIRNMRVVLVYQDIEDTKKVLVTSQAPFTKAKK